MHFLGFDGGPLYVKKQVNDIKKNIVIGIALNDTECGIKYNKILFYIFLIYMNLNMFLFLKCLSEFVLFHGLDQSKFRLLKSLTFFFYIISIFLYTKTIFKYICKISNSLKLKH